MDIINGKIYNYDYLGTSSNNNSSNVFLDINENENIIGIGKYCFANKNYINIEIEGSIESIDQHAFYNCKELESLILPEGLISIGDKAFASCDNLKFIYIPNSVRNIGKGIFQNCKNLESIIFPNNEYIDTIPDYTFDGCESLSDINMGSNITYIGDYVFRNCKNLISISLPENLSRLGYSTFFNCNKLYTINFPSSLIRIENFCFFNCTSLVEINLNDEIEYMGESCFQNCRRIKNIKLPFYLKNISRNLFYNCINLEHLSIDTGYSNTTYLKSIGKYAFYNTKLRSKNGYIFSVKSNSPNQFSYSNTKYEPYLIESKIKLYEYGYHYWKNFFDIFNYFDCIYLPLQKNNYTYDKVKYEIYYNPSSKNEIESSTTDSTFVSDTSGGGWLMDKTKIINTINSCNISD